MNRTPRDKALIEYGKSLGVLKEMKDWIIKWEGEAEYYYHRYDHNEMAGINEAIRDAWAKRKAFRLYRTPCSKCAYFLPEIPGKSINWCYAYNRPGDKYRPVAGCEKYRPRKEGK